MEMDAGLAPPLNSMDYRRGSMSSPLPGSQDTNDLSPGHGTSREHLSPMPGHSYRSSSPAPGVYHSHPRRQSVAVSMGLDLHAIKW